MNKLSGLRELLDSRIINRKRSPNKILHHKQTKIHSTKLERHRTLNNIQRKRWKIIKPPLKVFKARIQVLLLATA